MSMNIKKAIVGTAEFYGRQISENVLGMYYEDLCDLPEDKVLDAYRQYRRNPANRTFPLPAQIREMVCPGEYVSPETKAREVAARIVGAISTYGWTSAREAQVFIGPDGWNAVSRAGGWSHLCENVGPRGINPASLQAQLRDILIGDFTHGSHAIEQAIQVPGGPRTSELGPASFISLLPGDEPKEPA